MGEMFPDLNDHILEQAVVDNHVFPLIKNVSKTYSKIRMYHLGKTMSDKITGERVRKKFTKLILFKNQ